MLASIHPLGERARHNRWAGTAASYVIGSGAGGAALGATAGGLGQLVGRAVMAGTGPGGRSAAAVALAVAILGAVAGALDLGLGGVELPTLRRQVNEDWLHRYRGWVYGLGYGFQLGLGVVTIVTSAAVYLTFALALLTGSPAAGAAVGVTFGLVRAAPVLAGARVRRAEDLRSRHRRLHAAYGVARWATVAVLGSLCLAAASVGTLALAGSGTGP